MIAQRFRFFTEQIVRGSARMPYPDKEAEMLGLYIYLISAVLAASMVFASIASAITVGEFKGKAESEQGNRLAIMVDKQIDAVKAQDLPKGVCLESQIYKVDVDNNGVPDGAALIVRLVDLAHAKKQFSKSVESIVKVGIIYLAKERCSGTK